MKQNPTIHRRCTARSASLLISIAVLLSACATVPDNGDTAVQRDAQQALLPAPAQSPDGAIRSDTQDARVAQLWSASEQAVKEGRTQAALDFLVQALDITPRNSLIWSRAAELQLDASEAVLAESYAMKSNAFAGENVALLYRNWLIIEHARAVRGDLLGMRSAHKKVQEYQYR